MRKLFLILIGVIAFSAMISYMSGNTFARGNDNQNQNQNQNGHGNDDLPGDDNGGNNNSNDDPPGDDNGGDRIGSDDPPGDDNGGDRIGSDDPPGDDNGGNSNSNDDPPGDDNGGNSNSSDDPPGDDNSGNSNDNNDDNKQECKKRVKKPKFKSAKWLCKEKRRGGIRCKCKKEDSFETTDNVYITRGNKFPPSETFNVYVVPNRSWHCGNEISTDGLVGTVETDARGRIRCEELLGSFPPGEYDIVIDVVVDPGAATPTFVKGDAVDGMSHDPGFRVE